jgi:predicted anti-sigma-YlaC factor YlaD
MTCEEARGLLPEHVLGTLEGPDDLEVRRHLRGCASCRAEADGLGEGLVLFSRASHDRRPPAELRERVLTVLEEEWRDTPQDRSSSTRWKKLAAVAALIAGLSVFSGVQTFRASEFQQGSTSYRNILDALGGKDFRVGNLVAGSKGINVTGNIILYDAHTNQSWGLLIVHAPGYSGTATATLTSNDGHIIRLKPMAFDASGDASTYLVSTASLQSYASLTVYSSDGSVMATATIQNE